MPKPKRDYEKQYPSVTEILGVLRKEGLENYFKWNTPDFIKEDSEKAKLIGTQCHEVFQAHIEKTSPEFETQYPDEVANVINSFFKFKNEHPEIKLIKSEIKCTSEIYKYNMTLDCLGYENQELILFDWKSSKCNIGKKNESEKPVIYDESLYQISAYVVGYNEQYNTNVSKARIIAFAKDKVEYNMVLLNQEQIIEYFTEVFLSCLKIKWNQIKNKNLKKENK